MTYSIHDTRPLEEKESDLNALNWIQVVLVDSIAKYALENPQDLYDSDQQEILRKKSFHKAPEITYFVVIASDSSICFLSHKFPVSRMADSTMLFSLLSRSIDFKCIEQSVCIPILKQRNVKASTTDLSQLTNRQTSP